MSDMGMDIFIRPSFKKICEDACRAALLDLMLRMIAYERTWDATTEEIVECLAGSWKATKVRKEVNALIAQGYIGRIDNSSQGFDRTKRFHFGEREAIHFKDACNYYGICINHHTKLPSEVIQLLTSLDAINECCCSLIAPFDLTPKTDKIEIDTNREYAKLKTHIATAEQNGLLATLTLDEWITTLQHFDCRCAYCQGPYEVLEHFLPVVHKGGTTKSNCVPACYSCNSKKRDYHPHFIPGTPDFIASVIQVETHLKNVEVAE